MFKKLYISFLILSVLAGFIYILQIGLQEKTISKIKWSHFNDSREVAESIANRLRQETKDHQVIMFGVDPGNLNHLKIVKSWLEFNKSPGWNIDLIYIEPALSGGKEMFPQATPIDIREFEDKTVGLLNDFFESKKRILIIAPHIYVSQFIKENPVSRILKKLKPAQSQLVMGISLIPILSESSLTCVSAGVDYTGQSPLGCLAQEKSFFYQKKKFEKNMSGALDQYGLNDYLFFLKGNQN